MSLARHALPALGTSLLFASGAPDELAFRPPDGTTLTKTFTTEGEFALDEVSLLLNGQDLGEMIGQIEMAMEQESRIEVTDSFKSVQDGRPAELHRTFEELSGSTRFDMTPAQVEMPEVATGSELEGKTVVFRWNEDEQAYERSFHESDGDADLLEGLEEDMDLRVLLPAGEVAEGDSWKVPLADLGCLLMPGGNLRMLPHDMEVDAEDMKMFEQLFGGFGEEFGEMLEGECTCTYKGSREQDGVRLGEVEIELEIATTLDLTGALGEILRKAIADQGAEDQVQLALDRADLDVDFEGTGTLLWNAGAGHLHSFEIQGDVTIGFDITLNVEAEGESQDVDASLEMSGSMRQAVETSR